MFCKNCGKEIDDNSKFCQFCGTNMGTSSFNFKDEINKIRNFIIDRKKIFVSLSSVLLFLLVVFLFIISYIKSPEFAIYNSVIAFKDNDYVKATKYVNIEKISNNRIDAYMKDSMNSDEMRNNPFSGLAYMIADTIKPKLISMIKTSFKEIVESPDNVFQQVSKPKILLFTIIKKYDYFSMRRTISEAKKVEFKFSNSKNASDFYVVLNKTPHKEWEIIDIYGYDFWREDNAKYLEQSNNNTKDLLLNNAKVHYEKFKEKQKEYSLSFWKMKSEEKDAAFKKLYEDYLDRISRFEIFFGNNGGYDITREYAENHKEEFAQLGINLVQIEGSYNVKPDYKCLIQTFGIPKVWKDWLELQEKYALQRLYDCNESGCEGESLTINDIEQAIYDLGNLEDKSKEIASIKMEDYDYFPDTSIRFLYNYLIGNELYWIFDYGETDKLYDKVQKSYEHFIENHTDSKYHSLISEYYEKLKKNNFKYSDTIHDWVMEEIDKF